MKKIEIVNKDGNNSIIFDNIFLPDSSLDIFFLNCDLDICIEGFKKKQFVEIELSEFKYFLKNLELFNCLKINTVNFNQLDSIFDFKFERNGSEINLSGTFKSYPNIASLNFEFYIDQFYMDKLEKEISFVLGNGSNYPRSR